MKYFRSTLFALFLMTGCAHNSHHRIEPIAGTSTTPLTVITVTVGGGVNNPGEQNLARPFTIEHAIQQAGGLDMFEKDENREALVIKSVGHKTFLVLRKDYGSYVLEDGDRVSIPRH